MSEQQGQSVSEFMKNMWEWMRTIILALLVLGVCAGGLTLYNHHEVNKAVQKQVQAQRFYKLVLSDQQIDEQTNDPIEKLARDLRPLLDTTPSSLVSGGISREVELKVSGDMYTGFEEKTGLAAFWGEDTGTILSRFIAPIIRAKTGTSSEVIRQPDPPIEPFEIRLFGQRNRIGGLFTLYAAGIGWILLVTATFLLAGYHQREYSRTEYHIPKSWLLKEPDVWWKVLGIMLVPHIFVIRGIYLVPRIIRDMTRVQREQAKQRRQERNHPYRAERAEAVQTIQRLQRLQGAGELPEETLARLATLELMVKQLDNLAAERDADTREAIKQEMMGLVNGQVDDTLKRVMAAIELDEKPLTQQTR